MLALGAVLGAGVMALAGVREESGGRPGGPEPVRQPGRVRHITVRGDLDASQLTERLGAQLVDAAREGCGLIVLELDGNGGRGDVVRAMGERVRASEVPVVAYLSDADDHRVGLGALILGVFAGSCWVESGTSVEWTRADDRRSLAPKDTDWTSVEGDLSGALVGALQARGADPALAPLLVAPGGDAWIATESEGDAGSWRPGVTTTCPEGAPEFVRTLRIAAARADGPADVTIRPEQLVRLRLARGDAPGITRVLAGEGAAPGATRVDRSISSGFAEAMDRAGAELRALTLSLQRATDALAAPSKLGRVITSTDYHSAGRRALEMLAEAETSLDVIQTMIVTYPELVRSTPAEAPAWPATIKSQSRALDRLKARAQAFASK